VLLKGTWGCNSTVHHLDYRFVCAWLYNPGQVSDPGPSAELAAATRRRADGAV